MILAQVHAGIEARHLVAIPVEHQRLPFQEIADPAFPGLAPARMVYVWVYVGIKAILLGIHCAPGSRWLVFYEANFNYRLDTLVSVLPGHHQSDGRAILIGQRL